MDEREYRAPDPDLTQLPTPSPFEPVVPLDVLQQQWDEKRFERRLRGMFEMDEPSGGMPALIERMQEAVNPEPDRVYPLLGWRNLAFAVFVMALVILLMVGSCS